jgi:hypothetical protein
MHGLSVSAECDLGAAGVRQPFIAQILLKCKASVAPLAGNLPKKGHKLKGRTLSGRPFDERAEPKKVREPLSIATVFDRRGDYNGYFTR